MADNIIIRDGNNNPVEMQTREVGGVHTPHQIVTQSDGVSLLGPTSLSALNVDLLTGLSGASGWFDASAYQSGTIQIIASAGISAGAVFFEQTNDVALAAAGVPLRAVESALINGAPNIAAITIAANSVRVFKVQIDARYIRVRISTAFVGGTVRASAIFNQTSTAFSVVSVTQPTASNFLASIAGINAEDSGAPTNPVVIGGMVRTALAPTTLVATDAVRLTMTAGAAAVTYPFAVPETNWQFTGALTTATAVAARTAGTTGIRNYVASLQYQNTSATATTVLVQDGASTIAQFNAPASMAAPATVVFSIPLRGTAATALNVNCGTAGANVLINVQGFQSV